MAVAIIYHPDDMWGNLLAELAGLFAAAILIELLLSAREEQRKKDHDTKVIDSVSFQYFGYRKEKGWHVILDLQSDEKIKDITLNLETKREDGRTNLTFVELRRELSVSDQSFQAPIINNKTLKEIVKGFETPTQFVIKWIDLQNIPRRKAYPIDCLHFTQKIIEDKPNCGIGLPTKLTKENKEFLQRIATVNL